MLYNRIAVRVRCEAEPQVNVMIHRALFFVVPYEFSASPKSEFFFYKILTPFSSFFPLSNLTTIADKDGEGGS